MKKIKFNKNHCKKLLKLSGILLSIFGIFKLGQSYGYGTGKQDGRLEGYKEGKENGEETGYMYGYNAACLDEDENK